MFVLSGKLVEKEKKKKKKKKNKKKKKKSTTYKQIPDCKMVKNRFLYRNTKLLLRESYLRVILLLEISDFLKLFTFSK